MKHKRLFKVIRGVLIANNISKVNGFILKTDKDEHRLSKCDDLKVAGCGNQNVISLISSTLERLKNIFVYFFIKLTKPKALLRIPGGEILDN